LTSPQRGRNKSAQGNALGLLSRVLTSPQRGRNKSAQGNALMMTHIFTK
jgi:hypothetical protein